MTLPLPHLVHRTFDESSYRSVRLQAVLSERLMGQNALVAAMQAPDHYDEGSGFHVDQSFSASRLTAGAAGFFTFTQCGERPDQACW